MTVVNSSKLTQNNKLVENNIRKLKLNGLIGLDRLPEQLVGKCVSKGFNFNILCIGETGIGKSTLMDTLFNTQFEWSPSTHFEPTVRLTKNSYDLQENDCRLKLSIIETVGFGDQIDKDDTRNILSNYIDQQFEEYLQEELKIKRNFATLNDNRIHVCLYFLCPTGHSIKSIDLAIMSKISKKVNIIPIIAKADTIAKSELHIFKNRIMQDLIDNKVNIYQFPIDDELNGELNGFMNSNVPFAVVGSSDIVKIGNKSVRARQYPWGVVIVDNEQHSDFVKLKEMVLKNNMQDLIEKTQLIHYEHYRSNRLIEMGFLDNNVVNGKELSITENYEAKHANLKQEIQKREDEIKDTFVTRVKAKETELKDMERSLQDKHLVAKQKNSEKKDRLEEKRKNLDVELKEFQRRKLALEQYRSLGTLKLTKKK